MESGSKRVLVVDDEPEILVIVAITLKQEGYLVQTASNGQEALELVAGAMPDLILLDMKMPIMNGWQFAAEFRERYRNGPPILVFTAAEDARDRAEQIGAQGWVSKPFDLDMLVLAIGQQLGHG